MTRFIEESGMCFGAFEDSKVHQFGRSDIMSRIQGVKIVEFALLRDESLLLVEAKTTAPRPQSNDDFREYILNIADKMIHSLSLVTSMILNRLEFSDNPISEEFKNADLSRIIAKFILVIPDADVEGMGSIREALILCLRERMSVHQKIWALNLNVSVAVMNKKIAVQKKLAVEC